MNLFPFFYKDESGSPSGFYYEVAELVFRDLGLAHKSTPMPIARVFREVSLGNQDMTVSYNMGDLVPDIEFFGSFGCQQIMLVPLKTAKMTSLKELKGKRVVFPMGGYFHKRFAKRTDFTAVAVNTTRSIFQLAARGRVDAVIFNNMALESYRKLGPERSEAPREILKLFATPIPIVPIEVSFSISKKSQVRHLMPQIEAYMKEAREQGRFAEIFKKYGEATCGDCSAMQARDTTFLGD
ncbi:MAG: transporter substrate-binding domain-containing protein [Kordiimonadaceae bacterium]|nr:transporter substrate-binding domain-containing protein [Kordiimonadaceae bacterium]